MATQHVAPLPDLRTPAQIEADEALVQAAETGTWEGFSRKELCTREGAKQIVEHCLSLTPKAFLLEVTQQPFRWKHLVFRLTRCEYQDGKAVVETEPPNEEFIAEVKNRIEANRFHVLPYYQGYGFISFPEDYLKYQD